MQDIQISNIWPVYDKMIAESKVLNLQSWALNLRCFEMLQSQKIKLKLRSLLLPRILGIVAGIGWAFILGYIFYHALSQLFMAFSIAMIMLVNGIGIFAYIRDIVTITRINYDQTILEAQYKMAFLESSIIKTIRLMWLQLPFYSTAFITNQLAATGGLLFWSIQIPITLVFTWLAIFLYRNISKQNSHKKWVKVFIKGSGLSRVSKALEFVEELNEFKRDLS